MWDLQNNKKVACIADDVSFLVHAMFSLYCKEKSSQPQVNLVLAIYSFCKWMKTLISSYCQTTSQFSAVHMYDDQLHDCFGLQIMMNMTHNL